MTPPDLIILDRDGTLNEKALSGQYILHPRDVELLPGAAKAVARLTRSGIYVAVATNQRCIGLGLVDSATVDQIHAMIATALAREGGRVDRWFVCPHLEGHCGCRKPQPGLLLAAMAHANVAPAGAVMIGDSARDVGAASRAGMRAIRLAGRADNKAWATVPSLDVAVEMVLGPAGDFDAPN